LNDGDTDAIAASSGRVLERSLSGFRLYGEGVLDGLDALPFVGALRVGRAIFGASPTEPIETGAAVFGVARASALDLDEAKGSSSRSAGPMAWRSIPFPRIARK
jgi:hypothetical protein